MEIPPRLALLMESAVAADASDLFLHEGRVPRVRLAGRIAEIETDPLDAAFFDDLWPACGAGDSRDHDAALVHGSRRFRASLYRTMGVRAAVLRLVRPQPSALASLGLPESVLRDWISRKSGLVLICGSTGSGKSTTLAAAIASMEEGEPRHVITIEDPIEYRFTDGICLFSQREVGIDTPGFAEGLRRALRQSPDVLLIGEIRDRDTARVALEAAETGHLVLSTLHAPECAESLGRFELLFPPAEREAARKSLSASLLGILCQKLLPASGGGRVAACEYFSNSGLFRKLVAEGRAAEVADAVSAAAGSAARSFGSWIEELVRSGRVTEADAMAASPDPQGLQRALRGISSSSSAIRR